jgi:hypothetical protein
MKPWHSILAAFLLGAIAGLAGLLLSIHHIHETLEQSVHYAWYDWFMYLAYPGYALAACFIDPTNPQLKDFWLITLTVIVTANGLIASLAWIAWLLCLRPLLRPSSAR